MNVCLSIEYKRGVNHMDKRKNSRVNKVTKRVDPNKHRDPKRRNIITDTSVIGFWEQEEQLNILQSWAERGLTNTQIARNIGITYTTFSRWLLENEVIRDVVMCERENRVLELANAMYNSAIGKEQVVRQRALKVRFGNTEHVEVVDEVHQVPRDQKAGEFLLKNWAPEDYKEKQEVDNQVTENVRIIVDDLPHDE